MNKHAESNFVYNIETQTQFLKLLNYDQTFFSLGLVKQTVVGNMWTPVKELLINPKFMIMDGRKNSIMSLPRPYMRFKTLPNDIPLTMMSLKNEETGSKMTG